ncbi:hypothetical protein PCC9214_05801 [Planktothrix tepida]|uniref:CHAT domain-containing protein n=2 Tax=Planktothrix TaxID=54304 RepID=A0A1J1LS14_9CYAN|nr:CHAT domain-containing protein [Planktothrix tepida]CAD5990457.1 hypothetical protein PCC9214_05801 [Planktothrix tepida]CUR35395.1 hypothetical protein PL9214670021 [Planktothrix tepida PCC 9214]
MNKKRVILNLKNGNLKRGFTVNLQIFDESPLPLAEISGKLPPAFKILKEYSGWQSVYCQICRDYNQNQIKNVSIDDFVSKSENLGRSFKKWISSNKFRPIQDKILEKLGNDDEIQIIIQTDYELVRRMPWHLWTLLENYPKAEIAFSFTNFERVSKSLQPKDKVRILAIFGTRPHMQTGIPIDSDVDRRLLESLPDVEIEFMEEPKRIEINDKLRDEKGWNILFFAGHGGSQTSGYKGCIYINETEFLTVKGLNFSLKKAIDNGLKIAIFNCCNGLGLAEDLAKLHIPQVIVMREVVPDRVAQEFLKYFLQAFSQGKSLYLAVRESRERLHENLEYPFLKEDFFPCASWLPVICQNLAEEPPTWQSLRGINSEINSHPLYGTATTEITLPTSNSPNTNEGSIEQQQQTGSVDEASPEQLFNNIKITMLGASGSGKTSYMVSMYSAMQTGVNGFTLTAKDMDVDLKLTALWEKLVDVKGADRWPQSTYTGVKNYAFELNYGFHPIMGFEWLDYGGDAMSDRSTEQDVQKLVEHTLKSSCLFLCISGEHLSKKADWTTVRQIQSNRMSLFIQKIGDQLKPTIKQPFPVAIIITKYDLCNHRFKRGIIEDVKQIFQPFFTPDSSWLTMICPVSLGKTLVKDTEYSTIEPVNVHLPIIFAIYSVLRNHGWQLNQFKESDSFIKCFNSTAIQNQPKRFQNLESEINEIQSKIKLLAQELEKVSIFLAGKEVEIDI